MRKQLPNLLFISIAIGITLLGGCSQPAPSSSTKEAPKQATRPEDSTVKPAFGEVTFTLPKDWIPVKQQGASAPKESESLSFIRKIDQSLWANPGPLGTTNLPMMNITITRRAADASRDDINPKKLGNNLVKQRVLTELVQAEEIQISNLPASKIVGDSPQQGRVTIVLLPHNGYLYKWSLFGTKPSDAESAAALDAVLASAQFQKGK